MRISFCDKNSHVAKSKLDTNFFLANIILKSDGPSIFEHTDIKPLHHNYGRISDQK